MRHRIHSTPDKYGNRVGVAHEIGRAHSPRPSQQGSARPSPRFPENGHHQPGSAHGHMMDVHHDGHAAGGHALHGHGEHHANEDGHGRLTIGAGVHHGGHMPGQGSRQGSKQGSRQITPRGVDGTPRGTSTNPRDIRRNSNLAQAQAHHQMMHGAGQMITPRDGHGQAGGGGGSRRPSQQPPVDPYQAHSSRGEAEVEQAHAHHKHIHVKGQPHH